MSIVITECDSVKHNGVFDSAMDPVQVQETT